MFCLKTNSSKYSTERIISTNKKYLQFKYKYKFTINTVLSSILSLKFSEAPYVIHAFAIISLTILDWRGRFCCSRLLFLSWVDCFPVKRLGHRLFNHSTNRVRGDGFISFPRDFKINPRLSLRYTTHPFFSLTFTEDIQWHFINFYLLPGFGIRAFIWNWAVF